MSPGPVVGWRQWSSGVLRALLDPARTRDYAVACGLALLPAAVAWLIGAHQTVTLHGFEFQGYWTRPNWMGHILVIPGTLFLFRWSTSRETATTMMSLTSNQAVLGTLHYISPEQLESRPVDARADLFSLGAVLYEMATGIRAFAGDTAASIMGAILHVHPPPVSALVPGVSPDLDRIITRCLAKDPKDRHADSEALLIELRDVRMDA